MGVSERTIAEFIIDQANECQSSKAFTKVSHYSVCVWPRNEGLATVNSLGAD